MKNINIKFNTAENEILFLNDEKSYSLMQPITLSTNDPVLKMICMNLNGSIDEVVNALMHMNQIFKLFNYIFPNQPERSKREDHDK